MPRPNPVVTTATLLEATGPRTWRAALPNGKEVIAHVPARHTAVMPPFASGDKVRVELTTYDFSMARIAGPA
jgi:translation initiation factor IF-1